MTTAPGMNWVAADSSVGYGLPGKQDFAAVVGLASSLLEHGYGMEERPFSELGLLIFNREMSEIQRHPANSDSVAVAMLAAWVRVNYESSAAPREGAQTAAGQR